REKDWTISAHSEASIEIKSLLFKKDFEKGTHALCELNLWFVEQLITRQDNTMLTWQQIKRIRSYAQQEEINESQIKSKKRKMSHKRSKKEWENKENLVHDNSLSSSITSTSKILKMRENEVEDVNPWIKRKNEGEWVTAIGLKHLKNMIAPEKKTKEKKESEVEHVTLAESWDEEKRQSDV
ncbi:21142_t:CDS:2, partial [Gigaspora rosea]